MPRDRRQRRATDLTAMRVLSTRTNAVMRTVQAAIDEVDPGQVDLLSCARDLRLTLDIAQRLDKALPLPEPVETWDGLAWVLVAGIALGIYRRAQKSADPEAHAVRLAERAHARAQRRMDEVG